MANLRIMSAGKTVFSSITVPFLVPHFPNGQNNVNILAQVVTKHHFLRYLHVM